MARMTNEAMAAGALGFATSRSLFHKSASGQPICTMDAEESELVAIAEAVGTKDGILQVAVDFGGTRGLDEEFGILENVAKVSGRLMTLPIAEMHKQPNLWRDIMGRITRANATGARMNAQALPRGIGVMFGLELSAHPFMLKPSYREVAHLPLHERLAALRDPARRGRILAEESIAFALPVAATLDQFEGM